MNNRSLARMVARNTMKKHGMVRICAHRGSRGHGSKRYHHTDFGCKSYFAAHWRDFI